MELQVEPVKQDIRNCYAGFLMGLADVVPGFSGGTVALLLGIYPTLVDSIACVDRKSLELLRSKQWGLFWERINGRFLVGLLLGIFSGILVMLLTVSKLLEHDSTRNLLLASFLGMLLAAAAILWKRIVREFCWPTGNEFLLAVLGLSIALAMTLSSTVKIEHDPSHVYVFLAGTVAVCAMVLPGISGAMILVLLGLYAFLSKTPYNILHGQNQLANLSYVVVFGLGCLVGLASIARILRASLKRWPKQILLLLWGLMMGACPALWPFQYNTTPDQPKFNLRQYQWLQPDFTQLADWLAITLVLTAFAVIFTMDLTASRRTKDDLPQ